MAKQRKWSATGRTPAFNQPQQNPRASAAPHPYNPISPLLRLLPDPPLRPGQQIQNILLVPLNQQQTITTVEPKYTPARTTKTPKRRKNDATIAANDEIFGAERHRRPNQGRAQRQQRMKPRQHPTPVATPCRRENQNKGQICPAITASATIPTSGSARPKRGPSHCANTTATQPFTPSPAGQGGGGFLAGAQHIGGAGLPEPKVRGSARPITRLTITAKTKDQSGRRQQ